MALKDGVKKIPKRFLPGKIWWDVTFFDLLFQVFEADVVSYETQ